MCRCGRWYVFNNFQHTIFISILVSFRFQDPKTCKLHYARVVLQTYIRPGSYKISSQTLGINEQIDPHFSNTELEWATKERGAIVLAALLLKVE